MGRIVAGALAPHPPHLVYADNPEQNEPTAECGWETLRWGYERLRNDLEGIDYDTIVVFSPHWQTYVGTHFLGVPHFKSKSVDPIFPNLFRFNYDLTVDVPLAEAMCDHASRAGLVTKMMRNPDFRVDYGTIVSAHMTRPQWDKPIVSVSSNRSFHFYSAEVMQEQALTLGRATKAAIEASDRKVLLLASNSLSHRHFISEPAVPEDMSKEHIYNHHQYLWDMKIIEMLRKGDSRGVIDVMPEFVEQSMSEAESGSLSWLLSALDFPTYGAELHGFGTVIGTGNAVMSWKCPEEGK
ncbi:MAG: tRNA U-34 5-methylaminomethyl-2-thiouridine biosynthesis protein [Rhodobacterales bacterium]|nr:tRNA U-34 5-methylaminomethyl-2-thiouridine biosynthesis protein [Rhodobacterales bacterium]